MTRIACVLSAALCLAAASALAGPPVALAQGVDVRIGEDGVRIGDRGRDRDRLRRGDRDRDRDASRYRDRDSFARVPRGCKTITIRDDVTGEVRRTRRCR